ncbi:hypothetical protein TIFTF001_054855 [Ficus carica]|uniref:Uncharacterized protein n=1 Tax=Ficus carica TaxID=3494 RepID=A0AA88JIC4_FICCA|nr:hypothetical protein TIFTF001_054855 [Ficus carica]
MHAGGEITIARSTVEEGLACAYHCEVQKGVGEVRVLDHVEQGSAFSGESWDQQSYTTTGGDHAPVTWWRSVIYVLLVLYLTKFL